MARRESIAVGGFFKTPTHLLPRIAHILQPTHEASLRSYENISLMDPCAGEGEAIITLAKAWTNTPAVIYACEMEKTRFETLENNLKEYSESYHNSCLHGDAFRVLIKKDHSEGVSVLYLNPPYDTDKVWGRLEHKFLERFTSSLTENGVLLFVVPYYALEVSAAYLATHYENLSCYKFPEEDFQVYKQVVLVGRKLATTEDLSLNKQVESQVLQWARGSDYLMQELPTIVSRPAYTIPTVSSWRGGLASWEIQDIDYTSLVSKSQPWTHTPARGVCQLIKNVLPEGSVEESLLRKYPVATPPRPAHVASGIAAGVFNGSKIAPDDPKSLFPDLLVKGVFTQEYRTVEEKTNKKGEIVGEVQIQQPKLITTVLDLNTHKYHTLQSLGSGATEISQFSISDLLNNYGKSLMHVMEAQCPIMYDPRKDADSVQLAETHRKPFEAQAHAARALVQLLGGPKLTMSQRRGKAGLLLGEIGSGKSITSIVVTKTIGAKRPLIICPPHLLTSWTNEIQATTPEVQVRVISNLAELEALVFDTSDEVIYSIMNRETAKLGHGWIGTGNICPKCGAELEGEPEDQAKRRAKCQAKKISSKSPLANVALRLCRLVQKFDPTNPTVTQLLPGRLDVKLRSKIKISDKIPEIPADIRETVLAHILSAANPTEEENARTLGLWLFMSTQDENVLQQITRFYLTRKNFRSIEFGQRLVLLFKPHSLAQKVMINEAKLITSDGWVSWSYFNNSIDRCMDPEFQEQISGHNIFWNNGKLKIGDVPVCGKEALDKFLFVLGVAANFRLGKECGGPLFSAIAEPRRVALAKIIQTRFPKAFDFLILDETHENKNPDSAQSISAQRLTSLKIPHIELTGSVMDGYASSFFSLMQMVSPKFREEFAHSELSLFIERYGYRKRLLMADDSEKKPVAFGSHSDRIERARIVGNAPGVLPLFILKHLLPVSVTLHKSDLSLNLPKCIHEKFLVRPTHKQKENYDTLKKLLVDQIKADRFDQDLRGKLFGQLAELGSYLDRATNDVGNSDNGDYEIRYPESVGAGLVACAQGMDSSDILPKEEWMIARVKEELAEGRNVMVFSWHLGLLPRLSRILEKATGVKAPILYAAKVPTAKRQEWITKNIVNKGARILVTNPVCIQTGLNNLTHFSTEIWTENPAVNPITYRQASGRIDRIGAKKENRVLFPVYQDTLQEQMFDLLMQKVSVSTASDGLDNESVLLSLGATEEYLLGLSIGRQLWAMMGEGD